MGAYMYINSSSEIGGRGLIGAWALKGRNTVHNDKNAMILALLFIR